MSTIEQARRESEAAGKKFPEHLWIQVDNASGENKNQYVMSALATLVKNGVFKSVTLAFLCSL
jgi:hypothetical protein